MCDSFSPPLHGDLLLSGAESSPPPQSGPLEMTSQQLKENYVSKILQLQGKWAKQCYFLTCREQKKNIDDNRTEHGLSV